MQNIDFNRDDLINFCRDNHVLSLSFFGSVLTDKFRPDSDIDILIEFEQGHTPGLFKMARLQRELSHIMHGREVDLRTSAELSVLFRDDVVRNALIQFQKV